MADESALPRIAHRETVYDGWGRMLKLQIRLRDGSTLTREVEDHGQATGVLAYDPERRVALLVRQLRAAVLMTTGEPEVLEAIAGLLDEDDPEAGARREADEEAGLRLGPLERVVCAHSMPGISSERIHLFLASYTAADRTGQGGGLTTEGENITVAEVPLAELARMADEGRLPDMKTMLLVQTLRLRRPDLFAPRT
jgi:nudix-type nucleoside diphosphatase (YffH/AdpP family)